MERFQPPRPHAGEPLSVLYLVRPGEQNEELRFSLRSLRNMPFVRDVTIAGYKPSWVTDVRHIPGERLATKYATTNANLLSACECDELTDDVIMMNDDMFAVRKVRTIPTYNHGTIRDVLTDYRARVGNSTYVQGMADTLRLLEQHGHTNPLSFELHTPMIINREGMADALRWTAQFGLRAPHKRSIYSAGAGLKGKTIHDVKVYTVDQELPQGAWVSSTDNVFKYGVGNLVRWLFPNRGPYET